MREPGGVREPAGPAGPGGAGPGGNGPAVLELRGVTKRYPGCTGDAVTGVDLAVRDEEIVALAGESGCGKTTLLRLVAGLEAPDRGEVWIGGRRVAGPRTWVPPERRGVGMVFQEFALFPHLRVIDNVAFGLRGLPRRERRPRAEEMLERVGLAGLGERHPHQLSGGQRQRVALARALAPGPRLLLLDEPFSNLDTPLKAEIRDEVGEALRASGVPALLVVHDRDDVFALADQLAVMRCGRILQSGRPEALYRGPAHVEVARFFGETNLLPARRRGSAVFTPLGSLPARAGSGGESALVRPEHVRVSRRAGEGTPAVVRAVRPHGGRLRLSLALESEEAPGATLTALIDPDGPLHPGDRVYVSARAEEVRLLRDRNGEG